jgi:hypothetical protein
VSPRKMPELVSKYSRITIHGHLFTLDSTSEAVVTWIVLVVFSDAKIPLPLSCVMLNLDTDLEFQFNYIPNEWRCTLAVIGH